LVRSVKLPTRQEAHSRSPDASQSPPPRLRLRRLGLEDRLSRDDRVV